MPAKQRFFFNIDVIGSCNLSCPTCPTGNSSKKLNPTGAMAPGLLRKILDKAISECEVSGVGLFNWNEPVLHPKLAELIRVVRSRGIKCTISSNLNHFPNMEAVIEAHPDILRISNSGFNQEVYERTHRDGDIEKVKRHMRELSDTIKRTKAPTKVHVLFHRYKNNLDDELPMRQLANELGFQFIPVWAMMMPLEKLMTFADHQPGEPPLTDEDIRTIDNLALPLKPALLAGQKANSTECRLRDAQMTIDVSGTVQLCCSAFDSRQYGLGPFLDLDFTRIQSLKNSHAACTRCMKAGAHVYSVYGLSEFETLAAENIGAERAKQLNLSAERRRHAIWLALYHLKRHVMRLVTGQGQ